MARLPFGYGSPGAAVTRGWETISKKSHYTIAPVLHFFPSSAAAQCWPEESLVCPSRVLPRCHRVVFVANVTAALQTQRSVLWLT